MVDTSARLELDTAAHAGNLTAAQRAMERMRELIPLHSGYVPYAHFGPASIALLRGQSEEALEQAEAALALTPVGQHPAWPWVVGCLLEALLKLDRCEEARRRGLQFVADAERVGLGLIAHQADLPLALAEARLGDWQRAIERVERCIATRERLGCNGLNLGWTYEARARIAIVMGDPQAFHEAAAKCAEAYGHGRSGSLLAARFEALRTEARQAGLEALRPTLRPGAPGPKVEQGSRLASRARDLLAQATHAERYAGALALLLEALKAREGVLYRYACGELSLGACALPNGPPPEVAELAARTVGEFVSDEELSTCTFSESGSPSEAVDSWRAQVLGALCAGEIVASGVVLWRGAACPAASCRELFEMIGKMLAEPADDVPQRVDG